MPVDQDARGCWRKMEMRTAVVRDGRPTAVQCIAAQNAGCAPKDADSAAP